MYYMYVCICICIICMYVNASTDQQSYLYFFRNKFENAAAKKHLPNCSYIYK